jgi:hypothetical protein
MANTAVNRIRRDVEAARAEPTFEEAQSKAREWADKAIDLYQVGNLEQTRHAARQAQVWLARMRASEAASRRQPLSTPAGALMRLLASYRAPAASPPPGARDPNGSKNDARYGS